MPALLKSVLIAALANVVALAVAAWLFDGFTVDLGWFVFSVVLFSTLMVVLRGIVLNLVGRFTRAYTIVGSLVLSAMALLITDRAVPDDGFALQGAVAWIGTVFVVWTASVAFGEVDDQAPPKVPPVERQGS